LTIPRPVADEQLQGAKRRKAVLRSSAEQPQLPTTSGRSRSQGWTPASDESSHAAFGIGDPTCSCPHVGGKLPGRSFYWRN